MIDSWLIPPRGTRVNIECPITRGLLLYHPMNDGVGPRVFDASGNARHGVFTAMDATDGWRSGPPRIGSVISFGGGDKSRIDCDYDGFFNTALPFSVALWMIADSVNHYLCAKETYNDFGVSWSSTPAFRATFNTTVFNSVGTLNNNQWYFWVFTYDGVNCRHYIDGRLNATSGSLTGANTASDMWHWGEDSSNEFEGDLGQGAIWQRCLRPSEISTLFRDPYIMLRHPITISSATGSTVGDFYLFEEFAADFGNGIHDFSSGGDTFKVGLINDTLAPTQAASAAWGTFSANEVSGTGYTAGGATLANQSWTEVSGVGTFDADDTTWSMNAAGPTDARYAIIYNDSDATTPKAAVGWMDLGGDVSLRQGDIVLHWAATGIHRFTYQDLS